MHPTTAWLRASLRLWKRRYRYRRRRLRSARRSENVRRIAHWSRRVDQASYWTQKREQQIAARRPLRSHAADVMEEWARAGVREQGGNNVGLVVSAIIREAGGTPGEPWCGDGVAAAYLRAAKRLGAGTYRRVRAKVTRAWAYVPTLAKVLIRVRNPKRGHVVTFDFQGDGVEDHTGLFLRWIDRFAGRFLCVEANTRTDTSVSDAGGGEGVHVRERNVSQVASFRRLGLR